MKLLRLVSIAWILAAIVAGLLGAFALGIGERTEERTVGLFLAVGALLAAGSGTVGWLRPTTAFAQWSVLLAAAWVVGSLVVVPGLRFEGDRALLGMLPAALPVVAGCLSLADALRPISAPAEPGPPIDAEVGMVDDIPGAMVRSGRAVLRVAGSIGERFRSAVRRMTSRGGPP